MISQNNKHNSVSGTKGNSSHISRCQIRSIADTICFGFFLIILEQEAKTS